MKNRLKEILAIQSESYNQVLVYDYIVKRLKAIGADWYDYNGCIYATKGIADSYPCMVSHMDTVHDIGDDLTVIEVDGKLTGFDKTTMRQTGIGGDDKVGIYIALECLEHFDFIKAVFFRDEEVGCEGSYNPDVKYFDNVNFALQCDRKGYGDFITSASGTKLSGHDFQNDIKPILDRYKYKFESGMMTDVMALKESGISCAMANMSCAYYNPHTSYEYVSIVGVKWVLQMVMEIITSFGEVRYTCKYKKKSYYGYVGGGNSHYSKYKRGDFATNAPAKSYKTYDDWDYETNTYKGYKGYDKVTGKYNGNDLDWDDKRWQKHMDAENSLPDDEVEEEKDYCGACGDLKHLTYVPIWNAELCHQCIKDYAVEFINDAPVTNDNVD